MNSNVAGPILGIEINTLIAILCFILSMFGIYLVLTIKRPCVFKVKVGIVYTIPLLLSIQYTGLSPRTIELVNSDYSILLLLTFAVMLNVLYWREIRWLTTSVGYHKHVLVNFLDMLPDMVWMKDKNDRFTYTNEAIRRGLLFCTCEEAFGKTSVELAEIQRSKGNKYLFGEVCGDSDAIVKSTGNPEIFLESGEVNGKFLALQVFKAPLYKIVNGKKHLVGTIGMGRDLTYDYEDHEELQRLFDEGKPNEALELFAKHKERYKFYAGHTLHERRKEDRCTPPKFSYRLCSIPTCEKPCTQGNPCVEKCDPVEVGGCK